MKQYILHIETAPKPMTELIVQAPVFKAASNLKDATKIAEDIEKKKNKYFEEAAFNEATGSICAIGLLDVLTEDVDIVDALGRTEQEMLSWLFDKLASAGTVTFRGCKFTYPFICRRAAIYGNINFFTMRFYKYYTGKLEDEPHIDIAKMWACGGISHPESIKEITDVLGVQYNPSNIPYHKQLTNGNPEAAVADLKHTLNTINTVWKMLR